MARGVEFGEAAIYKFGFRVMNHALQFPLAFGTRHVQHKVLLTPRSLAPVLQIVLEYSVVKPLR
jgi:hypothetical protein